MRQVDVSAVRPSDPDKSNAKQATVRPSSAAPGPHPTRGWTPRPTRAKKQRNPSRSHRPQCSLFAQLVNATAGSNKMGATGTLVGGPLMESRAMLILPWANERGPSRID